MKLKNITFDEIYKLKNGNKFGLGWVKDSELYYVGKAGEKIYYIDDSITHSKADCAWTPTCCFATFVKDGDWIPITQEERDELDKKFNARTADKKKKTLSKNLDSNANFDISIEKYWGAALRKKPRWRVKLRADNDIGYMSFDTIFATRKEARIYTKKIKDDYKEFGLFVFEIIAGKWKEKLAADSVKNDIKKS